MRLTPMRQGSGDTMNRRRVSRVIRACAAAVALAGAPLGCSSADSATPIDAGAACMPLNPPATCPSPPPSYKGEIQFIVADYCAQAKCHAPGGAESVHDFTTYQGVFDDHLTFAEQLAMCPSSSSGMPPLGYPQPTAAQRLDLITWASVCKAPDN
jgi:hypothetical protein